MSVPPAHRAAQSRLASSVAAPRLAQLLGVSKQAASRLTEDMVSRGLLSRGGDPNDRRRTPLQLTELGERVRARALAESGAMELELRQLFGDSTIEQFRTVLTEFVESHGAGAELAASRSRAPSDTP